MERKNPFLPLDPRPLPPAGPRPLEAILLRGQAVESRHRVHVALAEACKPLRCWGDPQLAFFPRSAVKPIQALAWWSGARKDHFGLGERELAIACGSHEGEPVHTELVEGWLGRLGLSADALECGAHEPNQRSAARELCRRGQAPSALHNNCSGQHSGLLTACVAEGWPTGGYANYDHPVQARVRECLALFFGEDPAGAHWGIDGCGIPTYSVTLAAMAEAMKKLARPQLMGSAIAGAVAELSQSLARFPDLLGGSDSFSSKVVAETEGRVFAKVGAEGVYGLWIPADGIGIAIKCEDGSVRGAEAAVVAVLRELGYTLAFPSDLQRRWSGEVVGQIFCG